jgi:hypothetical protein
MALITSGSFSKALWPGVNAWYGNAYNEFPVEWTDLFSKNTSRKAFEEDVGVSGFGLARVKTEGAPVEYDDQRQAFTTRYSHVTYALGFQVSREAFEDDLYDVVAEKRAKALALSMRQTKETVAANVYNRAFTSTYAGGDGKELLATDHPNLAGGTWANELTTAANLSEAALEQASIDIQRFTNDRGLKMAFMGDTLIIPPELMFEAERILKSQYRVGTDLNDVNALVSMGKFKGGVKVNHYLTSTTAWFFRTNCPDGMKYWERVEDKFQEDNDFDTQNAKFMAYGRYSFGWSDPRGLFGTPGV